MRVLWASVLIVTIAVGRGEESGGGISRDDFPKDFDFGASTSAYQVEGATAEDGRGPSILDTLFHGGIGDIASDGYHKYKEDVHLMEETGLEGYRFSISWSRLIPDGRGKINPEGLEYYNNLINELISHGIEPHVTLIHFDFPEALEDERMAEPENCAKQQGVIGLNVLASHWVPLTDSSGDISATKRARDFCIGWFIEPLLHGDYPKTMRKAVGKKMPKFSQNQSKKLANSFEFISVNYYRTIFVEDNLNYLPADQRDFYGDMSLRIAGSRWDLPHGLQGTLEHFKQAYGNPPIYIHENGYPTSHGILDDTARVKYMSENLASLRNAMRNGSNARGYFSWSFVDVFEYTLTYSVSFGLHHVDIDDKERRRYPKLSAQWCSNFLKRRENSIYIGNFSEEIPVPHVRGKFSYVSSLEACKFASLLRV